MEENTSDNKDNVKVVLRVRPMNERETAHGATKCLAVIDDTSLLLDSKPDTKTFNYDYVADEPVSQEDVFNKVARPIADSCLEGYNGTIFAYGQTGSGKTYTIQGPGFDEEDMKKQKVEDRGILPRSFEYIFSKLDSLGEDEESKVEYLVKTSYLEIYNEQIMDLLNPTCQNLQIREDIKKGVYVEGLIEEVSNSADDMLHIIKKGALKRHTGSTLMNKESSRSHSVLTTTIESKIMKNGLFNVKISKFHIIDLAGSERAKSTDAAGARLKEAGMINKSLSALGNVINSLVDVSQGKSRHVHYRDSKLTFLLRDSLGGNSKTLMIANISPASDSFGETLSTLKFAQRAKLIKNKAIINEDSSGTVAILKDEIKRLKQMMTRLRLTNAKQLCSKCDSKTTSKLGTTTSSDEENSKEMEDNESSASKNAMKDKKLEQLEDLLKKNLSQLTQMQQYYDREIYDKEQVIKRLKFASDSFEKQQARDNMIIKFRDSTIARFGGTKDKFTDEEAQVEFTNLQEEINYLKQQLEDNPKLAKMLAEVNDLKQQLTIYSQNENAPQSKESLEVMYKSCMEFVDELKDYIDYSDEQRREQSDKVTEELTRKIEALKTEITEAEAQTEGYRDLLSNYQTEYELKIHELEEEIVKYKDHIEAQKNEIKELREKEIEDLKNKLVAEERAKHELHNKSQTLYEEKLHLHAQKESLNAEKESLCAEKETLCAEKESLHNEKNTLYKEKLTIEKLFEEMKKQYSEKEDEYKQEILKHKRDIENYKQKVENMTNSIHLKDEKINFLQEIKLIKEKLEAEISKVEQQNETLKSKLGACEEDLDIATKQNKDLTSKLSEAELKIISLSEELDTTESQYKFKVSELESKVGNLGIELDIARTELKKVKNELADETEKFELVKRELKAESDKTQVEYKDKINKIIEEKMEKINELKAKNEKLTDEVMQFELVREQHANDMEIKNTELMEMEQELVELVKERQEMDDMMCQLIDINDKESSTKNIGLSERIEELHNQITAYKNTNESLMRENEELRDDNRSLKTSYKEVVTSLSESREDQVKLRYDLKENIKIQSKLKEENKKLTEDYKAEIADLTDKLDDFQKKEEQALIDQANKENEAEHVADLDVNTIIRHPAIVKLIQTIKRIRKESQELIEENKSLKQQLENFDMFNELECKINPTQKIKHFQKIKDENNFLKRELVQLYNQNKRLKSVKADDDSQSKSVKVMEQQVSKMQKLIDTRTKELRDITQNANKICDYILSRPCLPPEKSRLAEGGSKIKKAIEAISYMNVQLTAQ